MSAEDNQYPPPPQPDQQHYNPIYSQQPAAPLSLEDQQDQLTFAAQLSQHAVASYEKVEHEGLDPATTSQIEQRIEQLQHQQSLQQDSYQDDEQQPDQHSHQLPLSHVIGEETPQSKGGSNKLFRLRKACDSCSIRKVKCDEAGPPCRACAALDIPCTFERPSRRRGPPNRHAESIKRRRLEDPTENGQPASPTHAAQALASLSNLPAAASQSSADAILPDDVIAALIDDYFTLVFPLYMFPHEPSFREAWKRREDRNNRPFSSLLAAMIAALVAAHPRRPRHYLKTKRREKMFVGHVELVDKCFAVCDSARGSGFLRNNTFTIHDAVTSFLLGVAELQLSRWHSGKLYLGECLMIMNVLGLDRASDTTYQSFGMLPDIFDSDGPHHVGSKEESHDSLTLQISQRLFWSHSVTIDALARLGAPYDELSFPFTPLPPSQLPLLPLEVDDACIFPEYITPQANGAMPMVSGLIATARICLSVRPLLIQEPIWLQVHGVSWESRKAVYRDTLVDLQTTLSSLPEDLQLFPNKTNMNGSLEAADTLALFSMKSSLRELGNISNAETLSEEQRRDAPLEVQKASIHAFALAARAYIVERYLSDLEALGDEAREEKQVEGEAASTSVSSAMYEAREDVVQTVVLTLSCLEKANITAPGDTLARRIRVLASKLAQAPQQRKGTFALQANESLGALLFVLSQIDTVASDPTAVELLFAEVKGLQGKLAGLGSAQLFPPL